MKILIKIIVLIVLLQLCSAPDIFSQKKYPKQLYSRLVRPDKTIIHTFDGGITFSIIDLNEKNISAENNFVISNFKFTVYPNPLKSNGTVQFELEETSQIELYYYNKNNKRIVLGEGILTKGQHEFSIFGDELKKGLNVLYIEINEKKEITKFIKI